MKAYKFILTPIVVFAVMYLLASFVVMDMDARNWHIIGRAMYILVSIVFSFLTAGIVVDEL